MDMTNKEYGKYVEKKAAPSPTPKNLAWAFVTGGLICTLGQGLLNLYRSMGLSETSASIAVPVTLIFLAVLFTGLGWFDKLAKHAGAGTLEFRSEGLIMGVGAKLFVIAGPVLVYGISASVIYGLLLVLFTGS